eukprot:11174057-Lingulodinium_polyedra.AAC.1
MVVRAPSRPTMASMSQSLFGNVAIAGSAASRGRGPLALPRQASPLRSSLILSRPSRCGSSTRVAGATSIPKLMPT